MTIELLNTTQAAELVGLKKATLISLRKKNQGPLARQIGREYLYKKESLLEWLSAQFGK